MKQILRARGVTRPITIVVVSTAIPGHESAPGSVETVIAVGADPGLGRREVAGGPRPGADFVADPHPREIPGAPPGANMSGPSFAAARVSGLVAGLLAEDPGLTPEQVRERLRARFPTKPRAVAGNRRRLRTSF